MLRSILILSSTGLPMLKQYSSEHVRLSNFQERAWLGKISGGAVPSAIRVCDFGSYFDRLERHGRSRRR